MNLRPYQAEALERVRAQLRAGRRRIVIVLPTGGGKTIIAAMIILSAYAKGKRVVFFAHRRELIRQTAAKLELAGIPAGDIGIMLGSDSRNLDAPVIVASIATWVHRAAPPADLVFIDEAHRSCSDSYLRAIAHYRDAGSVVLGLTATPFRADGHGLGDVYEVLEVIACPSTLIAEGFLAAPRVFSTPSGSGPDLTGVRVERGDYVAADLASRMNTAVLISDIVNHWQKLAVGRRTVVFATSVDHSRSIAEAFTAAGVAAEHLDGETPNAQREAILARLESGETRVVSNCAVLTEGWDQPSAKVCILARPTKSLGLYIQMAGRVLRPWENETPLILIMPATRLNTGYPMRIANTNLKPRSLKARTRRPFEFARPAKPSFRSDAQRAQNAATSSNAASKKRRPRVWSFGS